MKNYIANGLCNLIPLSFILNTSFSENGSWDTSKAFVRRTFERCIHTGRQHRAHGRKEDEYEAYRLLGTAVCINFVLYQPHYVLINFLMQLHTLEDFAAHSNFCELALVHMGHNNVFVHVGDQVRIQAANGKWVAPLVTGNSTFMTT
jgi:hypothetical protein